MQVDEQTLNKGAMREKRVQAALQVALRNLAELEGTAGMVVPLSVGLTPACCCFDAARAVNAVDADRPGSCGGGGRAESRESEPQSSAAECSAEHQRTAERQQQAAAACPRCGSCWSCR